MDVFANLVADVAQEIIVDEILNYCMLVTVNGFSDPRGWTLEQVHTAVILNSILCNL